MATAEEAVKVKSSWADEVEFSETVSLPPPTEVFENDLKIVTEYKYNEDGQKIKIVRTYKLEKRFLSKSVAARKSLKKFGDAANDNPGPNPSTTIIGEEVFMHFITGKDETKLEDEGIEKLKAIGDKNVVKCRTCNGNHWTSKCPWKDTKLAGPGNDEKLSAASSESGEVNKPGSSRYIPPSLREGATNKGFGSASMIREETNTAAIRISNISCATLEEDLEDLVKPFGPIHKLYLAKDKQTGICKGFAYVHFRHRTDAAKAIAALNGYGYDHLILSVDWSKS